MAGAYKGTLEALLATVIDGEQGALNVNVVAQGAQPTPMGAYKGTPEALLATVVDGEMGAINVNVLSGGGGGGGGGGLKTATLTITDAQIKALLATPLPLVTPPAGMAAFPVAVWAVCHFDAGIYVDPDQIGNITIQEQGSTGKYTEIMVDNDFLQPVGAAIGATTFYQFWQGFTSGNPTAARLLQVGPSSPVGGGPLVVQKDLQGAVEFTGGGTGNYIKLVLWYLEAPTS